MQSNSVPAPSELQPESRVPSPVDPKPAATTGADKVAASPLSEAARPTAQPENPADQAPAAVEKVARAISSGSSASLPSPSAIGSPAEGDVARRAGETSDKRKMSVYEVQRGLVYNFMAGCVTKPVPAQALIGATAADLLAIRLRLSEALGHELEGKPLNGAAIQKNLPLLDMLMRVSQQAHRYLTLDLEMEVGRKGAKLPRLS